MVRPRPINYIPQLMGVALALVLSSAVDSLIIPPPWANVTSNPCAAHGWQKLYWPEDDRCHSIYTRGPCPSRMELIWQEDGAVCSCLSGYVWHTASSTCHRVFSRGPCPHGQWLLETSECQVVTPGSRCSEGQLLWPADSVCYSALTRGPCRSGQLLIPITLTPPSGENNTNSHQQITLLPTIGQCHCDRTILPHHYHLENGGCYQLNTRGPCDDGKLFVYNSENGRTECACNTAMTHYYHINTGQCFELGARGPCPHGNQFIYTPEEGTTACKCRPGTVLWPPTGSCYLPFTDGTAICSRGQFVVPDQRAPHRALCVTMPCRRGELYHPGDKYCYRLGHRGPCPRGQLVQFAKRSTDGASHRVQCGCSQQMTHHYWPPQRACFQLNTQGPCADGRIFIYSSRLQRPQCVCDTKHHLVADNAVNVGVEYDERPPCRCRPPLYYYSQLQRCVHYHPALISVLAQ